MGSVAIVTRYSVFRDTPSSISDYVGSLESNELLLSVVLLSARGLFHRLIGSNKGYSIINELSWLDSSIM